MRRSPSLRSQRGPAGTSSVPSLAGDWPTFYAGFERAIREGAPVPVDPGDAVAVLRVLDAARRSAGGGEVERLSLR